MSDSVSGSDVHEMAEAGSRVLSGSEHSDSDSDFAPSPSSKHKRRKNPSGGTWQVAFCSNKNKIRVPWIEYGVVRGWDAVLATFQVLSEQCDCKPIMSRSGHANKHGVTYRMECPYANRLGCGWQCRVVIRFDQNLAAEEYLRKHPEAPHAPGFVALDRTRYCKQTMFAVKQELRLLSHTDHVCIISTAGVHSKHTGYQAFGAHVAWEAFVRMHPYALTFARFQIQQWLEDRKIQCIHEQDDGHGNIVQTNQMRVMVESCKRFCERLRTSMENDTAVKNGYAGKLLAMCEKYCLKETIARLGHTHFDPHTPYIIPGWSADTDEDAEPGGLVVLLSTMNLALNHARAQHWYAGNVTMAIDHTFKVLAA